MTMVKRLEMTLKKVSSGGKLEETATSPSYGISIAESTVYAVCHHVFHMFHLKH